MVNKNVILMPLLFPHRWWNDNAGGVTSLPMPAGAHWSWTEAYGPVDLVPAEAHSPDWTRAVRAAETYVTGLIPFDELQRRHDAAAEWADTSTRPMRICYCLRIGRLRRMPRSDLRPFMARNTMPLLKSADFLPERMWPMATKSRP